MSLARATPVVGGIAHALYYERTPRISFNKTLEKNEQRVRFKHKQRRQPKPGWFDMGAGTPLKRIALGTVLVALVVIGLALVVMLRYVFLMLFLGIVLATALAPLVERLRRWNVPQGAAVLVAFGLLLLAVSALVAALLRLPFFVGQIVQAVRDFPTFYGGFRTSLGQSDSRLLRAIGLYLPADLVSSLSSGSADTFSVQATALLPSVGQTLLASSLVLLLSYYWLYSRTLALQSVVMLLPLDYRADTLALWNEIEEKIGAFVRGLAVLSLVIGVLSAIGYVAIGLPYGLTIAIIAGLLEAVPYVGPIITLILAGIVGLTVSQTMALLAIGIAMVIQLLENAIVVPRVMDKAVGVSPVVTLLALAIFSDLFGLLGALLQPSACGRPAGADQPRPAARQYAERPADRRARQAGAAALPDAGSD